MKQAEQSAFRVVRLTGGVFEVVTAGLTWEQAARLVARLRRSHEGEPGEYRVLPDRAGRAWANEGHAG